MSENFKSRIQIQNFTFCDLFEWWPFVNRLVAPNSNNHCFWWKHRSRRIPREQKLSDFCETHFMSLWFIFNSSTDLKSIVTLEKKSLSDSSVRLFCDLLFTLSLPLLIYLQNNRKKKHWNLGAFSECTFDSLKIWKQFSLICSWDLKFWLIGFEFFLMFILKPVLWFKSTCCLIVSILRLDLQSTVAFENATSKKITIEFVLKVLLHLSTNHLDLKLSFSVFKEITVFVEKTKRQKECQNSLVHPFWVCCVILRLVRVDLVWHQHQTWKQKRNLTNSFIKKTVSMHWTIWDLNLSSRCSLKWEFCFKF